VLRSTKAASTVVVPMSTATANCLSVVSPGWKPDTHGMVSQGSAAIAVTTQSPSRAAFGSSRSAGSEMLASRIPCARLSPCFTRLASLMLSVPSGAIMRMSRFATGGGDVCRGRRATRSCRERTGFTARRVPLLFGAVPGRDASGMRTVTSPRTVVLHPST